MDQLLSNFIKNIQKILVSIKYPEDRIDEYISQMSLAIMQRAVLSMGKQAPAWLYIGMNKAVEKKDTKLALNLFKFSNKKDEYADLVKKEMHSFFNTFATRLLDTADREKKEAIKKILDEFNAEFLQ